MAPTPSTSRQIVSQMARELLSKDLTKLAIAINGVTHIINFFEN